MAPKVYKLDGFTLTAIILVKLYFLGSVVPKIEKMSQKYVPKNVPKIKCPN